MYSAADIVRAVDLSGLTTWPQTEGERERESVVKRVLRMLPWKLLTIPHSLDVVRNLMGDGGPDSC